MKKVWEKPKLIVLVRAEPEESVLASCKLTSGGGGGSGSTMDGLCYGPERSCRIPGGS